jgi:predicted patatin/cPLA2 family phospholipase
MSPGPAAAAARAFALATLVLVAGCGTLTRNPVPTEFARHAEIAGMPDVRAWRGTLSDSIERDLVRSFAQESRDEFPVAADGHIHYAHLALSGGGANGAFGAGFLNGWTKAGTRPTFKIVTGVSTGALMAPFAFLGSAYDDALREFYTTTTSSDIFTIGTFSSIASRLLTGDAIADSGPLESLIARHIDDDLLRRVAEAHRAGRRLYVGTVDLDSQRFVVWNMGQIASYGHREALGLFRKVILASASIPIAFPPVLIDVQTEGGSFDEMHVDGGVAANIFYNEGLYRAATIRLRGGLSPPQGREDIYVIHNGQLRAPTTPPSRRVWRIAPSVLDTAMRYNTVGDLFRIHSVALASGAEFRWVTIPNDAVFTRSEFFDPVQMRALYDTGFRLASSATAWQRTPPFFVLDD